MIMSTKLNKTMLMCFLVVTFYSCTFYYDNICSSADPKQKFIQNIVDNPEKLDSIIINSEYFDKDFDISISSIISKNDRFLIEELKGLKLFRFNLFEVNAGRFDENANKEIYIKEYHLGFLLKNSSYGILTIFELNDDNLIISDLDVMLKDKLVKYFEKDGMFRHTLY